MEVQLGSIMRALVAKKREAEASGNSVRAYDIGRLMQALIDMVYSLPPEQVAILAEITQ